MNINRVVVSGNLTRDPELKQSSGGTSICKMRLAVNTRRKNSTTGEWEDKPNFFNVTVFGRQADSCSQYLAKGRPIAVDGRLEWSEWEATDGSGKRSSVDIIAENVQFLGGREDGSPRASGADAPVETSDFTPAAAGAGTGEDDIPFLREEIPLETDIWHGHANR